MTLKNKQNKIKPKHHRGERGVEESTFSHIAQYIASLKQEIQIMLTKGKQNKD